MTTIRVTRRPPTPPVHTEGTPPSPGAPPAGADVGGIRLALIDPPAARTTLDGAWWPRTRDLTSELSPLVEELQRRGFTVTRVAYNPDLWEPTARRLHADGRTIRLGWFRSIDPQLLNLTGDVGRRRLDLLVVPPGTTAAAAQRAFSAATDRANHDTPTALLAAVSAAGPPVPPPRPVAAGPAVDGTAGRDTEGGRPAR
jgi:Family of unknown function (DUF5994)